MSLRLVLPWPEGLSPNDRLPDWKRRKSQADHRETARLLTGSALAKRAKDGNPFVLSPDGPVPLHITLHLKPKSKGMDDDNAIAALKWARDGIAQALRIDDKRFAIQPIAVGGRTAFGAVTVVVETVDDALRAVGVEG